VQVSWPVWSLANELITSHAFYEPKGAFGACYDYVFGLPLVESCDGKRTRMVLCLFHFAVITMLHIEMGFSLFTFSSLTLTARCTIVYCASNKLSLHDWKLFVLDFPRLTLVYLLPGTLCSRESDMRRCFTEFRLGSVAGNHYVRKLSLFLEYVSKIYLNAV